jgi:hypothetical protein
LRRILLGVLSGAVAYTLLLWLHGPWEELVAALIIGSAIGIADLSPVRNMVGSTACAAGWLFGSVLCSVSIELGVGAWLFGGAFLSAAFGAYRRWWVRIPAIVLGLISGLLAESSRYLAVFVAPFRGADMQLLLLLSAGLFLNTAAALIAPSVKRVNAGP